VPDIPSICRCLVFSVVAGLFGGHAAGQVPESVMVVEAHSGRILIGTESGRKRPVASLTKIATTLVALDWAKAAGVEPVDVTALVPGSAAVLGGPNAMQLATGEQLSLRDALFSAMLAVAATRWRPLLRR